MSFSEKKKSKKDIYIGVLEEAYPDFKDQYTHTLELMCVDACRNGLLQYRYKLPTKDTDPSHKNYKHPFINRKNKLTDAVYHAIKELFHEHEFHQTLKDSMIESYGSEHAINLKEEDNPALLFYLGRFEKALTEAVENISMLAIEIRALRKTEKHTDLLVKIAKGAELILERCSKLLGFWVYYNTNKSTTRRG